MNSPSNYIRFSLKGMHAHKHSVVMWSCDLYEAFTIHPLASFVVANNACKSFLYGCSVQCAVSHLKAREIRPKLLYAESCHFCTKLNPAFHHAHHVCVRCQSILISAWSYILPPNCLGKLQISYQPFDTGQRI